MRALFAVAPALAVLARGALAQGPIAVGPNVQVSAALAAEPHFEMVIAADPWHPERLMACSMLMGTARPDNETVTYTSHDRGRTWRLARRISGDGGRESWDPTCGYGRSGVAYSAAEGVDSTDRGYIEIARSPDGGVKWEAPIRIAHAERAFLTVDNSGGPRDGWLYLHGNELHRTTEGGLASSMAIFVLPGGGPNQRTSFVAAADDNYMIGSGHGVVLTDGTFLGPFIEVLQHGPPDTGRIRPNIISEYAGRANAQVKALVSSDGRRFKAVTIGDLYFRWPPVTGGSLPMLAADASKSPFRDRVYAVWADERSGRLQIYLSYSSDKGKTWSSTVLVSDDPSRPLLGEGPDNFNPTVAVNDSGVVGVAWYDRRDHANDLGWSVRFAASHDGGDSFSPSVRVSETDHMPTRPPTISLRATSGELPNGGITTTIGVHHFNFAAGHTAGLAADAGGVFHPIWSSNATGVAQLWTAAVTVPGAAARNGGGDLADLADATEKAEIRFLNRAYDRTRGTVEADVMLANTSADTLTGPLKVRVLAVESEVAHASLASADSGTKESEATWDFTSLVNGGRLAPGEASRSKRVRFTMANVPPYGPGSDAVAGYVVLRTRVLAGKVLAGKAEEDKPEMGKADEDKAGERE